MEWEVMFLCNSVGILLLVLITLFHMLGVKDEKVGDLMIE